MFSVALCVGPMHNRNTAQQASRESKNDMKNIQKLIRDERGQDLIEYALMAGFVAVAAGAIMPEVSASIGGIFEKVGSVLEDANTTTAHPPRKA